MEVSTTLKSVLPPKVQFCTPEGASLLRDNEVDLGVLNSLGRSPNFLLLQLKHLENQVT